MDTRRRRGPSWLSRGHGTCVTIVKQVEKLEETRKVPRTNYEEKRSRAKAWNGSNPNKLIHLPPLHHA